MPNNDDDDDCVCMCIVIGTVPCWRFVVQNIVRLYNQDLHMSEKDAKINFLQLIYKWQTFGSAFFEVKVGYADFW